MSKEARQPVDEISASKEMDEWVRKIGDRLDKQTVIAITPLQPLSDCPSIFGNWQSWHDFGASILPATKKWQFVTLMKRWFDLNVRSYLEEFQKKQDDVWRYYEGVDERFRVSNSKLFIEHLLVNSCFLIFAMVVLTQDVELLSILYGTSDESDDPNDQWRSEVETLSQLILGDVVSTQQYMLTIDYQIPWFVVKAIYTNHSNLSRRFNTPIHKLALSCLEEIYPGMHKSKVHHDTIAHPQGGFKHLLQIFHFYPRMHKSKSKVNDDTITLPEGGFKHLLHIFHWSRIPEGKFLMKTTSLQPKKMDNFYIPSATELQLSAIVFEKHANGSIDVDYSDRTLSGVMQLAPWHLFPYSFKIYESLLRFERGYSYFCGRPFTAYVACMVCLLQTEADVKLLRVNGIVPSTRNDDKDVLRYVKEFKTLLDNSIVMSADLHNLSAKMRAHHDRSASRCYAEFKSRCCSNPCITISVVAAICLFFFTFIQVVIQVVFGTLNYHKH